MKVNRLQIAARVGGRCGSSGGAGITDKDKWIIAAQKAACKKEFLNFSFIHLCLTALGLRCFAAALGCSYFTVHWASSCGGFPCFRSQAPGAQASVVRTRSLRSQQPRVLELAGFGGCGAGT